MSEDPREDGEETLEARWMGERERGRVVECSIHTRESKQQREREKYERKRKQKKHGQQTTKQAIGLFVVMAHPALPLTSV